MHTLTTIALPALLMMAFTTAIAHDSAEAPAAPASVAAASQSDNAARRAHLVGSWEEISPGHNYVDIRDDGKFVLYLKKGEIGDLKSLDGTWTLDDGKTFRVLLTINGTPIERKSTLDFAGEEMLLIEEDKQVTRHRRHTGELPAEYRW